ncbi:MAG: hypothetical protein PW786_12450 [Arachidicoccus sp.]|nr:hypothetical protein [Arachidicoccus sp.]
MKRFVIPFILTIVFSYATVYSTAQQGTTINLKGNKPPTEANKPLRAEKTGYDKLPKIKKFLQNTYTHYNYLFNANQIFNSIMQDAIASNIDDYSQLLSFYPYDENALKSNPQFDSVIQHATSGLLLHDLRNDYVDELYYVLGRSYYYQKKLDTARQTFQFINYAFAPKDEGYDIPVGSNVSNGKDKSFSISNEEAGGFKKNNLKNINRRNDALIWLAKTFIEQNEYTQAGILLNNIGRDKHFPERLYPLYLETQSYFFYKQKMYDSAAAYLAQCNFGDSKFLKARRAFLTAQMFQRAGNDSNAIRFYNIALEEGNNPITDIYAQKNIILLQNKIVNRQTSQRSLELLLHKNKYYQYKDLVYYNQAEIAKANNDNENAKKLLLQSIAVNRNSLDKNPETKSMAFLLLGNIEYDQNIFDSAISCYDSVSANYIKDSLAKNDLQKRVGPLHELSANLDSIHVQDSLLALANMPEKERMDILKQKAKQIRRAIDRKEENDNNIPVNSFVKQNQQPIDLFGQSSGSATWYFNNAALKNAGYQSFKQKFGNRPNVDNWQRISAINKSASFQNNNNVAALTDFNIDGSLEVDSANITAEDLLHTLPMTKEKKDAVHKIITQYMLANGEILMNKLENFSGAIVLFDSLIRKYPKAEEIPNALYDEYVCYMLLDKPQGAAGIKQKLANNYPQSSSAQMLDSINRQSHIPVTSIANAATKEYSDIYDLFLAGNFEEALKRKSVADKKYGSFYWTPQMLYIEAIYFATKRNDTAAISDLNVIINRFSSSPMVPQAKELIDVLKHRKEIEDYLAKLHIKPEDYSDEDLLAMLERGAQKLAEEKRIIMPKDSLIAFNVPAIGKESQDLNAQARQLYNKENEDTTQVIAPVDHPANNIENITDSAANKQPIQKNADTVQVTKIVVKNNPAAPDTTQQNNNIATINNDLHRIDTSQNLLPKQRADTAQAIVNTNPVNSNQPQKMPQKNNQPDIVKPEKNATRMIDGFAFDDNAPVFVTVVLDNVAPVYATESSNAFNRYNLLSFPNQSYNVASQQIEDENMVIIGPFKNVQLAKEYQSKIQPQASVQIIPWITQDKYSFLKISPQNMSKIHSKADLQKYRTAAVQAGLE